MADSDYEALQAQWQQAHSNAQAAHPVIVLPPDGNVRADDRWLTQRVTMPRWRYLTYTVTCWLSVIAMTLGWARDLLAYLTR